MLVEIPDPEVILGVILAFVVGMVGFYGYFKIRPFIKTKTEISNTSQEERLEYYERQLIDMKIRLDALEIEGLEQKTKVNEEKLDESLRETNNQQILEEEPPISEIHHPKKESEVKTSKKIVPESESSDITKQVLQLITTKPMTSRDIQNALNKSREHSSRFLKKLFEDGYVKRDTTSKPYTYSITKKGKEKIGFIENSPTVA